MTKSKHKKIKAVDFTFILTLGFATIVMLIGQPITNEIEHTNQMKLAEKI